MHSFMIRAPRCVILQLDRKFHERDEYGELPAIGRIYSKKSKCERRLDERRRVKERLWTEVFAVSS